MITGGQAVQIVLLGVLFFLVWLFHNRTTKILKELEETEDLILHYTHNLIDQKPNNTTGEGNDKPTVEQSEQPDD